MVENTEFTDPGDRTPKDGNGQTVTFPERRRMEGRR